MGAWRASLFLGLGLGLGVGCWVRAGKSSEENGWKSGGRAKLLSGKAKGRAGGGDGGGCASLSLEERSGSSLRCGWEGKEEGTNRSLW